MRAGKRKDDLEYVFTGPLGDLGDPLSLSQSKRLNMPSMIVIVSTTGPLYISQLSCLMLKWRDLFPWRKMWRCWAERDMVHITLWMNWSIFLMAQKFGLKLALGVIPLSSPCLHSFTFHTNYLLPRIHRLFWFYGAGKNPVEICQRISSNLSIYLFICTFTSRQDLYQIQTDEDTHTFSVPSPEHCIQSANIH